MINSIITCVERISVRPEGGTTFSEYLVLKRKMLFNFETALTMLK
jgi:hypothetical protein